MHSSSAKSKSTAARWQHQQALLAHLHLLTCEARDICSEMRELRSTQPSHASFTCLCDARDDFVRTLSLYVTVIRRLTAETKLRCAASQTVPHH